MKWLKIIFYNVIGFIIFASSSVANAEYLNTGPIKIKKRFEVFTGDGSFWSDTNALMAMAVSIGVLIIFAIGLGYTIKTIYQAAYYRDNPNHRNHKSILHVIFIAVICTALMNHFTAVNVFVQTIAGVDTCGFKSGGTNSVEAIKEGCWDKSGSEILSTSETMKRIEESTGDDYAKFIENAVNALTFLQWVGRLGFIYWMYQLLQYGEQLNKDGNKKSIFAIFTGLLASAAMSNILTLGEYAYTHLGKYLT